jgi:hypothetical protein
MDEALRSTWRTKGVKWLRAIRFGSQGRFRISAHRNYITENQQGGFQSCVRKQDGDTIGIMDQDYGAVASVPPGEEDQAAVKKLRHSRITSRN